MVKRVLEWVEQHRLETTAIALILGIATYCSVALTTNAAVDSLNAALSELQQQVQARDTQAEHALRGAVLDAYPVMLRQERAYNMNFRHGADALTEQDHRHAQKMQEVVDHYRPVMQAALRSGVRPYEMRKHMQRLILSDPYVPTDTHQVAGSPGEDTDQI